MVKSAITLLQEGLNQNKIEGSKPTALGTYNSKKWHGDFFSTAKF